MDSEPVEPSPHELLAPPTMSPAVGFAHAVVPVAGRTVHVAGQIAADPQGQVQGETFAAQYDLALANVVSAVRAAGGAPQHLVALTVYTTDMAAYRDDLRGVGAAHRRHLGRHFPAMAMLGVTELFEPAAMVEIVAVAVIPHA
ncbi:MAG TPA: RidA family protein [Euzebya sp.]|nr:RidA family protein [Euzebya sp.]